MSLMANPNIPVLSQYSQLTLIGGGHQNFCSLTKFASQSSCLVIIICCLGKYRYAYCAENGMYKLLNPTKYCQEVSQSKGDFPFLP